MALHAMQIVLALAILANAMAALSATTHQNAANQATTHKNAAHQDTTHKNAAHQATTHTSAVHQPEVALSFEDFVKQKQFEKRKTHHGDAHSQGGHRHKASLTAFASHLHQGGPPPKPYIAKIGIANVTKPTELPPPPPTLNPDTDMQPFDTRLGNWMASSFLAPPTMTPPPTQEALDLAYGCPVLEGFPTTLQIDAPNTCEKLSLKDRAGKWFHPQGDQWMLYEEKCAIQTSVLPYVDYITPAGQKFGSSRMRLSFFGNTMEILDCGEQIKFTIEEKIYHQTGFTDQDLCEGPYKSCHGTIFTQYFMRNHLGKTIAETPFLNLFQDKFVIAEPGTGIEIAELERVGLWSPWDACTDYEKLWQIKFQSAAPGIFGEAVHRWPIAVMMNMILLRDIDRRSNGTYTPSSCEIRNVVILTVGIFLCIILVILASYLFYVYCLAKAKLFFWNIEVTVMPHTMYKPSKYDG